MGLPSRGRRFCMSEVTLQGIKALVVCFHGWASGGRMNSLMYMGTSLIEKGPVKQGAFEVWFSNKAPLRCGF